MDRAASIKEASGPLPESHRAAAVILVEMECRTEKRISLQHDPGKYDAYFHEVRQALSVPIVSADGKYSIDVTVHMTDTIDTAAPAVWAESGHMPANVPFLGGANANGSRLGAFEVYLCTDFPTIGNVPPCSGLHSKLRTRKWPNTKLIARRCAAILTPVFHRWQANEDLVAALPQVAEAADMRQLFDEFHGRVEPSLIEDVAHRLDVLEASDATLLEATQMGEAFDARRIEPLRQALEESGPGASPSFQSEAADVLDLWIAVDTANCALRAAPSDQLPLRAVLEEFGARDGLKF